MKNKELELPAHHHHSNKKLSQTKVIRLWNSVEKGMQKLVILSREIRQ